MKFQSFASYFQAITWLMLLILPLALLAGCGGGSDTVASSSQSQESTTEKSSANETDCPAGQPISLRSTPETIPAEEAQNISQSYVNNCFKDNGDGTITDQATNLRWQQAGSDVGMFWKGIEAYLAGLNSQKLGGLETWRLPTIAELKSIIESSKNQTSQLFIDPLFSADQYWCWSADIRPAGGHWDARFRYGNVGWNGDDDCSSAKDQIDCPTSEIFVKAVASN